MVSSDFIQISLYLIVLITLTPLLGAYMAKAFEGQKTFLTPALGLLEKWTYRCSLIRPDEEMNWKHYTLSLLLFNFLGFLVVFLLQLFQSHFPLNPQSMADVSWPLALNTAISFVTNTNWQAYSGEALLGYLVQMLGLTVQNFLSAATGIAVFLALTRAILRRDTQGIGNFWVDLVRATLYVLLPLSIVLSLILISQGVVQNFSVYVEATTLEGAKQLLPMGPAASQIAIKQLGTNGGGFFGVNSAHPFENPTPLSNFLQMLSILLIPSALVYVFGVMTNARRHALMIYLVMLGLFLTALGGSLAAEYSTNPSTGLTASMEGKEVRFGVTNSILWSTATTAASNGSVNAMHDSLSPIAGGIAIFQMVLGEIIFGGAGAGLYGMLIFVLLTVFLAGLMVGRTPEYLGKKIEIFDVQMVLIAILLPCALVLVGTAVACALPGPLSSLTNQGPHGLSEILYAFGSASNNNGSAFGGLNANTLFFNLCLAAAMFLGRFGVIIPALALAGNLVKKKFYPPSAGTFSTDTPMFAFLLVGVILIVGALTFIPVLSLGPIVEHLLMSSGKHF